ncbi:ArpU family phage packaging/lysis transcriptional regulator [Bacillus halotolerans]|uniref:ArpU family phage packaging/lysis transcriptional regulator n=1 Tax=Bacillus halotolerans TaxID=260554 RepID=UPI0040495E91
MYSSIFDSRLIEEGRTISAVENHLKRYELARLRLESEDLPSTTQTYQLIPVSNNQFSSKVENYVEDREELMLFTNKVAMAINRLEDEYRKLIVLKYFKKRKNEEIARNLSISSRTFSRKRKKALVQLAIALGIVCWKKEE